jgi:hypothetical protein
MIKGGFISKTQRDCKECNGLGKCKECKGRGKSDKFSVEIVKVQCPRCLSFKQIESTERPLETKCDNCGLTIILRK